MWIAINYGWDLPESELHQFQDIVIRQDIPIVESQSPRRLPLDLQAEIHLPCDRASIAYRQWLKQIGVHFGTIVTCNPVSLTQDEYRQLRFASILPS